MYIPELDPNKDNEQVFAYDVNSLYPHVMRENMPVAFERITSFNQKEYYIRQFHGDISLLENSNFQPYGFFYVEVTCPKDIKHPILQRHFKNEDATFTMAPTGTWKYWYYSEELLNAKKVGYTYKIIKGYLFNKENIFSEYVNTLYPIKCNTPKEEPMYHITKLLLNSLYGRFGMNLNIFYSQQVILDKDQFFDYLNKGDILDMVELDGDKIYIKFNNTSQIEQDLLNSGSSNKDLNEPSISIPIASAITSLARIHMSKFKNNPDFSLFYTDTDSAYINKDLSQLDKYKEWISKDLGKLKLEHVFTKAIFLSPKVYAGVTVDNKKVMKIKGYKHKISFDEFNNLLYKNNSIELPQQKWYKDIQHSKITMSDQIYTLTMTTNKRQLLFNHENKFIGIKPYHIHFDDIID